MLGVTRELKVKDQAMVDSVKIGDQVRFVVEIRNSASGLVGIGLLPEAE